MHQNKKAPPMTRHLLQLASLATAACLGLAGTANAAPLDDLRRQVESSQVEQAWRTAQENPQLVGQPEFDFLYGLAALNAGRVAEGVLALERHLAAAPGNDRARLELARGYFLLGEYPRARSEFDFLLRSKPPAGVRANIESYLQAMQLREGSSTRAVARLYAEAGGGYDSNVNLAPSADLVNIGLDKVTLDPASRQVGDSFAQVAVGGLHQMRVSSRMSLLVGADLDHRANAKQHDFDLTTGGVYMGFTQLSGPALWRTTLGSSQLRVGNKRYRDQLQVATEANINWSQDLATMAFAQYAEMRHAQADRARDARSTTLGGMVTQSFTSVAGQPTIGARLAYVQEDNLRLRDDLSKKSGVLRLFGSFEPLARTRVALSVAAVRDDYGAEDIAFRSTRHDNSQSVDFSATYALDTRWSLRLEGGWLKTESNQDLYDKQRKSAALKLRAQF
jgi:tetratricopeptide (TPR) repeat protein